MRAVFIAALAVTLWGDRPLLRSADAAPEAGKPAARSNTNRPAGTPARAATGEAARLRDLQHHSITTDSPEAQHWFDRGMILVYAFNHDEAIRSFQKAAQLDPECAMAYWGIALAYGPNINRPMPDEAVPKAYQALQKARERSDRVSRKEQAYIEALSRRYSARPVKDRLPLDRAYADAMRQVARRYSADLDAATLYAEALMNTMPWDYWTPDRAPRPATTAAIAALERVLARDPSHLGANHYYIHIVEAGPHPERGLPSADRLAAIADRLPGLVPGTGHLVHMPGHIYLRLGLYHLASRANERALAADRAYLTPENARDYYGLIYHPHKHGFLFYSRMMEGRSDETLETARKVADEVGSGFPLAGRFRTLPLFALVRFSRWDEILAEPRPPADRPFETAVWHYARGMAHAGKGRLDEAVAAAASLDRMAKSPEIEALEVPFFYGLSQVNIAREDLAARIAALRNRSEQRIAHLEKAVALQDALPYMEPPYWYYPVRHSLGAALLSAGRAREAEAVYREDLRRHPRNGWALFGLAQSLRAQGKTEVAAEVEKQFRHAWLRADVALRDSATPRRTVREAAGTAR